MFSVNEFFREVNLIRDPVYGFIEVPKKLLPFINHKLVQRLRWISQLPLEQLVYPSAQHSRFEHSLGVMYLSMQVAISLLKNKKERNAKLNWAFKKEDEFNSLKPKDRNILFITAAGICGLLHDLGHAPFSHTLEEAVLYTAKNIEYNHENISFLMTKVILEERRSYSEFEKLLFKTVLAVLNKSLKEDNISPLKRILRSIIDGPLDADKGDYLLRDSYHCGVIYGVYDLERLWRHIRITEDWHLGVSEKGAVEAWTFRIARYKMYQNVYKHHVRNITDALLISIFSDTFDDLKEEEIKELLPIFKLRESIAPKFTEEEILKFSFWTENEILKKLLEISSKKIKSKVERFLRRSLPKRFLSFPLEQIGVLEKDREVILKIKRVLKRIGEEKEIELFFLISKKQIPPVFTSDVQRDIRVVQGNKEISLAKFLGFNLEKDSEGDQEFFLPANSNLVLEVFAEKDAPFTVKRIIEKELKKEFQV